MDEKPPTLDYESPRHRLPRERDNTLMGFMLCVLSGSAGVVLLVLKGDAYLGLAFELIVMGLVAIVFLPALFRFRRRRK